MARRIGFPIPTGELRDLYAATLACLSSTLASLGYIDQARSRLNEALSEARQLRLSHTKAEVLVTASSVNLIIGSPEMQQHTEELLALSTERGLPFYLAWATVLRGVSLTALGQGQEGRRRQYGWRSPAGERPARVRP
jgi:hypothetical protein